MDRVTASLRLLLEYSVDYAGLFPPAQLPLKEAARLYGEYRRSPHAWMLGAFVCPAAKLEELAELVPERERWPVTVLAQEPFECPARLACEWVEAKAADVTAIRLLAERFPRLYVEIPPCELSFMSVVRDCGARAKIRTGGDTVPPAGVVARFIAAAIAHRVPFKATAGLHHPIRSDAMHGFLNVIVASVLALSGVSAEELTEALDERDAGAFTFQPDGLIWRYHRVTNQEVRHTRRAVFTAFGSCSFEEPVQDLEALGLL